MNEDLLKHLFEKYQLSSVGTFDEFKNDMSSVDVRKSFFNNHELSKVGTFEEFENDLGANNISSLTAHQKALLDTISDVESPDYNVITGGKRFQGYDQHPNIVGVVTPAGPSTAAGKYQITKSTWDRIQAKLHLPDFSPESQDKAAIWLAQDDYRRRTNRELDEDLQSNDPAVLENIRKTLSPTWEGLAKDKTFVNRYQPRAQSLVESMGSAQDPMGSAGVTFAQDVDPSKFDQKTLDELYIKAGGTPGEAYETDIKHDDDTFLGMFKTNRYNISFKDKEGVKSTKYLDRNNAGVIDRFDAALVNVGIQTVSGLASLAGAAIGVTEDAIEAVLTGDTNFDKTMDYADNAVNDYLNTQKSKQITNASMLSIEEKAKIAEENKGAFAGLVASLSKLGESQYWEQEGADMLGSQLAFGGLGLAASGAIKGTELGIGLTKVLTKVPLVSEKVAEKIVTIGTGTVLNASAEAVQEASLAYKDIKQQLLDKGLSEEEATKQASDAASEIFGTNFMMLLATNFIELQGLTDGISTSKHALVRGVINTLVLGISEGVQESFQTGATDYSTEKALKQPYNEGKNTGVFDSLFGDGDSALGGTLSATYHGLMDGKADYWDSFAGGFGVAAATAGPASLSSIHQLYTKEKPIMSKVNSSLALSANDIYKTDEDGKLIYDSNNKPQIDPTKQLSAIRGMNNALQIDQLQEEALKNNNGEAIKVLQAAKISSIVHDHLFKGDSVEAIENAINNSMTKKDYEQNKLSEFYSYEEFKDIKRNILDIAKDNYTAIYSNPLLKNNSAEFKQSIYHNSVQQDLVTKELDKYSNQLENLKNKEEKLNSLQKEEKKSLESKIESLKTYKTELIKAYDKFTSNKTADTKITEEETNAQEVAQDFKNGKTEEEILKNKTGKTKVQAIEVIEQLKNEEYVKKLNTLSSLDEFESEKASNPDKADLIDQIKYEKIKGQKTDTNGKISEVTKPVDLIERYGQENELLRQHEEKGIARAFRKILANDPEFFQELQHIEAKKADPNYQYTPNPKFKNLTEHIAKGGTEESYINSLDPETVKDKIDDPIFQRAIDNFNGKETKVEEEEEEEFENPEEDDENPSTIPVTPIPDVNIPVETGSPDNTTSLLTVDNNHSETIGGKEGHKYVDIEVWENNAPTGTILTLTHAEVKELFHSSKVKELIKIAKSKNTNLSDNLTFKKRIVNNYLGYDNKDTVHVVNNVLQPGDKIYYKIPSKGWNEGVGIDEGNFGLYMVAYVLNDTIVEKGTPNAKEVIVGHVRSNGNIQSKDIDKILRKNLYSKWDKKTDFISEPVPVKGIHKKASLHVGKFRAVTREDIANNEFDVVITDFEKTASLVENYKFANSKFSPKESSDGKGKVENFIQRQLGKVFMFLPSTNKNGKEEFIPVELETKKVKEVTSYKKKLVQALNDIANAPVDQVNDIVRKKWAQIIGISKGELGILRYRTPDSSFDRENKTDINPDGGLGPVITYYTPSGIDYLTKEGYENASKLLPGFAISTKGKKGEYKIEYGLSVDQVVAKLGEVRVHVPSHNTKDFLLEHPDLVSTDLKTIDEGYYEQGEVYIDVERTSSKEEIETLKDIKTGEKIKTKDVIQSTKINKNLGKVQTINGVKVYTQNKNRKGYADNYIEDAFFVSNDIIVMSDGMSDSAEGSLSHQLVEEIAKRKGEIKDKQSLYDILNSLVIKSPDFTNGSQTGQIGTLILYIPKLNKIFSIGDSFVEINGEKIKQGIKTNVNFNIKTNSTVLAKNKSIDEIIQEVDVKAGDNVLLYTDEVPNISNKGDSFDEIINKSESLRKENKSQDDVTVIEFKVRSNETQVSKQEVSEEKKARMRAELENNTEVPEGNFFAKYTDDTTTVEEFKEGAAEKYIKDRFENLGVKVSDEALRIISNIYNVGDGKVWGAFYNAVVYLSSDAGLNVGKHEAFHVAFNLFLNDKQRKQVLNEAYKKYGKELGITKEEFENDLNKPIDSNRFKVEDQVDYVLKAVDILQSEKAKQIFNKGRKNNWSLDKILTELAIPKEQKELIEQIEQDFVQKQFAIYDEPLQYALELASNYSYTVEINTAKEQKYHSKFSTDYIDFILDNDKYEFNDFGILSFTKNGKEIGEKKYSEAMNEYNKTLNKPTQYYSNLTVPGGTNYTENEIAIPGVEIQEKPQGVPVKQGVSELFESNPELANSVYEALGFTGNISDEQKQQQKSDIERRIQEDVKNIVKNRQEIEYETTIYDQTADGNKRKVRGKSPIIDLAGRKVVVLNVNGMNVPFYLSTGHGGKADVTSGKWYPIFGIAQDGWMNKLSGNEINNYYDSKILKLLSEELDTQLGDIRNDNAIPKAGISGSHIDFINRDLTPTENGLSSTRDVINKNIENVKNEINAKYDAELAELNNQITLEQKQQQITPQQKQQAQELYSQYLDTIFPDSKVKDIVYHGSSRVFNQLQYNKEYQNKIIELFIKNYPDKFGKILDVNSYNIKILKAEKVSNNNWHIGVQIYEGKNKIIGAGIGLILNDNGITLFENNVSINSPIPINNSFNKNYIGSSKQIVHFEIGDGFYFTNIKEEALRYGELYTAILDIKNPSNPRTTYKLTPQEQEWSERYYEGKRLGFSDKELLEEDSRLIPFSKKLQEKGFDGIITPSRVAQFVVFEPEQIHILGSKQDIEGFKSFIKSNTKTVRKGAITPSIKGHAQFSTDKGIGWFRSDEEYITSKDYPNSFNDENGKWFKENNIWKYLDSDGSLHERADLNDTDIYAIYDNQYGVKGYIQKGTNTKTRRILEVQSDLFQKGRDKDNLINEYSEEYQNVDGNTIEEIIEKRKNIKSNQFLQLLNKDNNWVTFFVKSIIQDSAKKGYEKVLFPTGNTASKVEGHTTLEEFKKQKEDRIKELEKDFNTITNSSEIKQPTYLRYFQFRDNKGETVELDGRSGEWLIQYQTGNQSFNQQKANEELVVKSYNQYIKTKQEDSKVEINQLKQELERIDKEGFGALKPIYNFYENTVSNILNKTYGKDNVKQVTDEHGNTWNEITIDNNRDQSAIRLKSEEEYYKKQNPLIRLEEKLAELFETYKATDGFVSENFKKKYPKIAKFLDSLYNFIYDSYQQLKPYFTTKISVEDLFYQLDRNIFGRSIFGGRTNAFNKNYSENFARLLHQGKFKVSNIKQIREHAKFIAQNLVHLAVRTFKSNTINKDGKKTNIAQYYTYNAIIESGNKSQFNKEFFNELPTYIDLWFQKHNSPEQLENYGELKNILENKEDLLKLQLYIAQYMNNLYSAGVQITQDANEFDEKTTLIRDTNVNPKTNVKGKIRELMSLIPVRERELGHYVDKIDPKTGAKIYHNFDVLFNRLLNKLSGSSPEQTMLKLIDLAKTKDYADTLVEKIKNELVGKKILQSGEDINVEKLDKNSKKYDPEYVYKLSASKWFKNLYLITGSQRNIVFINTERSRRGIRVHNSSKKGLWKMFKRHAEIMFLNKELDSLEFLEIYKILENSITNNNLLNAVDIERIYTFLGYNIDQEIAVELESNEFSNKSLSINALPVFNAIKEGKNPFSVIESKLTKQQIKEVSDLLAKHDQQSYVMNITTVQGEAEYIHQMNNHLTTLFNKFKESPKSALATIKNKILHKDLPIYDALLSKSIEIFEPHYDNGIGIKGTYNGITYNKYFNYDLITQQLNYALERMYNSNGKEIVIALPPFSDATSSGYMNAPTVSLDDVVNKLVRTAHAELNRIIYLENNKTNYRNFNINGKHFILLPFLNSKKDTIIELYKANGGVELGPELTERLEGFISSVLNKKFEAYTEKLVKDGVLVKEGSKLVKTDDIIDDSSSSFKDDLEGDIKTQFFNQYYYNTQLIPLLAGDPAFYGTYKSDDAPFDYKNSLLVDFLKRFKEAHSPKQHALFTYKDGTPRKKRRITVDDILIPSNELDTLKEDFPELAGDYNKGHNITDAQTINSIDFTVDVMRGFDEISDREIEIAERIKNGESAEFVFPVQKPYYFNQEESGELLRPFQEKNSEYTLTPAMAWLTKDFKVEKPSDKTDFSKYRRPFLAKILYLFHEHGIDGISFQSVNKVDRDNSKVLKRESIDNMDIDTILASVVETSMEGYGRQNIVPSEKHFQGKIEEGSQFKVIMPANLEEEVEVEGYGKMTPEQVRSVLDETFTRDIDENRVSLNEALKDTDSLRNTLLAQASEQGKPMSVIESLSKHQDGDLNIPLNFPLTIDDNLKLINSKTKKALNNKVPGAPFVNASSVGFTDLESYQDNLEIHYKTNEKGETVIDYIDAAVPAYNYALALLADDRGLLDFTRIEQALGKEATDELRKAFGYRIPTEGDYSIYPIKIKYLIPSYSDSLIILPKEATTITGLDFDIDKLYVLFKAFELTKGDFSYVVDELNSFFADKKLFNENTGEILTVEYDNSSAKALFNKVLNRGIPNSEVEAEAIEFLREPERFRRIKDNITISNIEMVPPGMETPMARHNLRMSIYEKIAQTRNFAEEFHKGGNADMLRDQIKAFEDKGVVLEDTSVPMDISDPIYQIYAANKAIVGGEIIGIAASHNKHHAVVQNIEGLKLSKPFTFLQHTYSSLSNMRNRNNKFISESLSSILFASTEHIKNPLMDKLNIDRNNVSMVLAALRLGIPFGDIMLILNQKIVKDLTIYINTNLDYTTTIPKLIESFAKERNLPLTEFYKQEFDKNPGRSVFEKGLTQYNSNTTDIVALVKIKELFKISDELTSAMIATKFDTDAAFGPTLYDNLNKIDKIRSLLKKYFEKEDPVISGLDLIVPNIIFNPETANYEFSKENASVLKLNDKYIQLAMDQANNLKEHFSFLSPEFEQIRSNLAEFLELDEFKKSDRKMLDLDIYNMIFQMSPSIVLGKDFIRDVSKRFADLKKRSDFKELYEEYLPFLNALKYEQVTKEVLIRRAVSPGREEGEDLTSLWEKMMKDPNEEISSLAKDLGLYSLITSSFRFTIDSFSQWLPVSFYTSTEEGSIVRDVFKNPVKYLKNIMNSMSEKELSERILYTNPFYTRNVDIQNHIEALEEYSESFTNEFNGEVSKSVIPISFTINENLLDIYSNEGDSLPEYLHSTVYYENATLPVLYKKNPAGVYEIQRLNGNPKAFKNFNLKADEQSFYPDFKMKYHKLNSEKTKSEHSVAKAVNNTYKQDDKIKAEEIEISENEVPKLEEDVNTIREYTPDNITFLKPNEIFVFGSNEGSSKGGKPTHGAGAALLAKQKFGAIQGQSKGLQGQSYAVITKKYWDVEKSSSLSEIGKELQNMILFARANPNKKFLVTKLGSSLAGYSIEEIKSLFEKLKNIIPDNVILPREYEIREILPDNVETLEKEIIVNGQKLGLYSNGTIRDEKGVEVVDEKLINMFQVKHGYNPLRKVEHGDLKVYVLTDNRIIDISAKDAGKEILTLSSPGIIKIKNEILRKLNEQLSPVEKTQEFPDDLEIKGPPALDEDETACGPTREA